MSAALVAVRAPLRGRLRDDEMGPTEAWIDQHAGLKGSNRAVMRAIAWYVDRFGLKAYPSVAQLVARSGVSESTVHRVRRRQEASGLLLVQRNPGRGLGNIWAIHRGANVTPLRLVGGCQSDTPSGGSERGSSVKVTPHGFQVFGLEQHPPYPPQAEAYDEPASPALNPEAGFAGKTEPASPAQLRSVGSSRAGTPRPGAPCPAATARGSACPRCRACGTTPRQVWRAQAREARYAAAAERIAEQLAASTRDTSTRDTSRPPVASCPHGDPNGRPSCALCRHGVTDA